MVQNQIRLDGQTAIVTGASSGIGKETAIELGKAGANVIVNYIGNPAGADEALDEIAKSGGHAIKFLADVSNQEQVRAMVKMAVETYGTVDILVNNAGMQKDAHFVDMTLEDWNLVLKVNLTGQFICAQEVVKEYIRRATS